MTLNYAIGFKERLYTSLADERVSWLCSSAGQDSVDENATRDIHIKRK